MPRKVKKNNWIHNVNADSHESPEIFRQWLDQLSQLQIFELEGSFRFDVNDGILEEGEDSFNRFISNQFYAAINNGWSLSSDVSKKIPCDLISKSGNWFTCPTAGGIDYSKHVFSTMEEATKFANQNMIPINNIDTIHLLPKGEYFIGDPLHAFKRKFDYLEEFFPSQKGGVYQLPTGEQFAIFKTFLGDGIYDDNAGNCYFVDTAKIAVLPLSICSAKEIKRKRGVVLKALQKFPLAWDRPDSEAGNISIASLTIHTGRALEDPSFCSTRCHLGSSTWPNL